MKSRMLAATVTAPLIASLTVLAAPNAHAVDVRGRKCEGAQVRRCLEVHWDAANDRFRAHATIEDVAGGNDYNVDVTSVEGLQDADFSGTRDHATGFLWECEPGWATYNVTALYRWRNVAAGQPTSGSVTTQARIC